jgi:hypothetical protein
VARLETNGTDPAPILRQAGVSADQTADAEARITVASQIAVLNLAADALGDEVLGFQLAENFELRKTGLLYFVLSSAATLGDALTRAERYSRVSNEGIVLQYFNMGECCISCKYNGVSRRTDRHQMEFWITAFARICQRLTDSDLRPGSGQPRPSSLRRFSPAGQVPRMRGRVCGRP